ncbi:MAG: hypothetical protein WC897_03830 [Candidatus Gracilibacteria bacterium]
MAQFQYTAVNSAGKKLSGVIGAVTEEEARKQLNTFGISLLAIEKTGDTQTATITQEPGTSSNLPKFEFEAYDKLGRKVLGTIPSSSRYNAFKRLMDEYQFEVSYVVPVGANEEERLKAKNEDLEVLKIEYEAKIGKTEEQKESASLSKEFEAKRQELLKKVDFILGKIKALMTEYAEEIRPDSKKLIQNYIDKLLRIKSSTNLDYIEHTSEELLKKVQDQELFLHKEKSLSQRTKLKIQTEEMMAELHARPVEFKITKQIDEAHERLSVSHSRFLRGLGQVISRFIPTEAEKELQQRIKAISRQIWTYRKIVWTAPKEATLEAKQSLERLKNEKNRLQIELKQIKISAKTKEGEDLIKEPLLTEEVNSFLGWLLAFYLGAYFLSHYLLAKEIPGGNPLPGEFNLLTSPLLRTLLISVFVWHILLTLRLDHLRYKSWANMAMLSLGLILNFSLIFNL